VYQHLEKYKEFDGFPVTYTRDNGANIRAALGDEGLTGAAHAAQTTFHWALKEGRKDKHSAMEKVLHFVEVVAGLAQKTKLNQSLVYQGLRKIPSAAQTRWDSVSDQVRAVSAGYKVITKHKAVVKKIPESEMPLAVDIEDLAAELEYFVKKRKIFERAGPTGHLVYPIYLKLRKRQDMVSSPIALEWAHALKKVIDLKAGVGTGRRTCLGGVISNLHLIQTYLNPYYKHLPDVEESKVTEIHQMVDKLISGIAEELGGNVSSNYSPEAKENGDQLNDNLDSDDELVISRHIDDENMSDERSMWLAMKHQKAKRWRENSTQFWETEGRRKLPLHAMLYYRMATKHPSEAWAERFFSLAGLVCRSRRGRTGIDSCRAIVMRHLWGE